VSAVLLMYFIASATVYQDVYINLYLSFCCYYYCYYYAAFNTSLVGRNESQVRLLMHLLSVSKRGNYLC